MTKSLNDDKFCGAVWDFLVLLATQRGSAAECAQAGSDDSGLRQSLHYVETSTDATKTCSICAFFNNPQGACGSCGIFNGPVSAGGHCDSWAGRS